LKNFNKIYSPDLLLLDDPTSSLDNNVTHSIMKSITEDEYWKDRTYVMTSNNPQLL
jgi:ABC-type multidrug transport system ATPase subunit